MKRFFHKENKKIEIRIGRKIIYTLSIYILFCNKLIKLPYYSYKI